MDERVIMSFLLDKTKPFRFDSQIGARIPICQSKLNRTVHQIARVDATRADW
jgi:hypothetical protein